MSLNRKTLYKSRFYDEINDIIDFISENSTQGAIKFAQGIKPVIEKIIKHPEANSIVRQIPTQRNWYRYKLYKKRYKIIFKVLKNKIVFLSIIHTSKHPSEIIKLRTSDYS